MYTPSGTDYEAGTGRPIDPSAPVYGVATSCDGCPGGQQPMGRGLWIMAPGDVATVLGAALPPDVVARFRAGAAIVLGDGVVGDDQTMRLTQWTEDSQQRYWTESASGVPTVQPDATIDLPAVAVDLDQQSAFDTVISVDEARRLGIPFHPAQVIATYDDPMSDDAFEALSAQVAATEGQRMWTSRENGPSSSEPVIWLFVAVAAVLVVCASAVCLGLARYERRPDDTTLSAVGGTERVRRAINAWQALVVTGAGAVVGTATAFASLWGICVVSSGFLRVADAPWYAVVALSIALPATVTSGAWAVALRRTSIVRREAIA